jgi:ribonuclease Z
MARKHAMCEALGLINFSAVYVAHRTKCYGAVLRHADGWSIAYVRLCLVCSLRLTISQRFSADTMPSNNLVHAGQNATLLIHEATMADEDEEMAKLKAHSTFSQAIDVGRRYSYPSLPPLIAC